MQIQFDIPDELALRLDAVQDELAQILELGLREWNADAQSGFSGMAEILEFLASLPSPEETLALKPSEALQQHINELQEKNQTIGLTATEERLWQQYEYIEHLVRTAKAKALLKLRTA